MILKLNNFPTPKFTSWVYKALIFHYHFLSLSFTLLFPGNIIAAEPTVWKEYHLVYLQSEWNYEMITEEEPKETQTINNLESSDISARLRIYFMLTD